jgi:outer membrane protein assembly factor BamB
MGGLILACFLSGTLPAADVSQPSFPQWRGTQRDGSISGFTSPATWPKELKQPWKVEVGEGHASPLVTGDRVLLISREGDEEVVRALSLADGKTQWSHRYAAPYKPSLYAGAHGKGPKATPVIAGNRLVTIGISSIVSCWEVESGKLLWQQDFSKKFKPATSLFYGMAVSPMVDGKQVIAAAGVSTDGAMVALDLETGRVQWKWNGEGPGYASPIIAEFKGTRQLLSQSKEACFAIAPADGSLLWSIPFKTAYDQNIVTPVVFDDKVVFSGVGLGTTAYRVEKSGDGWKPNQVWHNAEISMYMSSPILVDGCLYGLANHSKGQFFCMDALTGKTLWTSDGRMGENAALLVAGKTILALTTNSELIAFKADPKGFEVVARYKVAETPVWAHPAVVDNKILVKDRTSLTLWTIEK